jgi:hypothetical protein
MRVSYLGVALLLLGIVFIGATLAGYPPLSVVVVSLVPSTFPPPQLVSFGIGVVLILIGAIWIFKR